MINRNSLKLQLLLAVSTGLGLFIQPCLAQFSTSTHSSPSTGSSSGAVFNGVNTIRPGFGFAGITGRPVGTGTSEAPVYNGFYRNGTGYSPYGGVVAPNGALPGSGGAVVGQFGYYNTPGIGYYTANPMMPQYPVYPAPISLGDGFYAFGGVSARLGYWRAQSGYYYPWCPPVYLPGVAYPAYSPIYVMSEGALSESKPPVSVIMNDMRSFIEDAKEKKQLDQSNYENIFNTLNEITARAADFAAKNGGVMDASDESNIRRDLDLLTAQIARSLSP